jgi:hypothetical protein
VANHEGPRCESSDQPRPEVGDLSVGLVEERSVERYAGILGQRGPVIVEDVRE